MTIAATMLVDGFTHDPNRPPTSLATPNDWKAGRTASSANIGCSSRSMSGMCRS
ncbi:MAG: hypothetical protein WC340_14150 [Kiritimatiellia bacterium]